MAEKENIDPREIFDTLVSDHDSKVKHPNHQLYSRFPYGTDEVAFFKKYPKYFLVFEDDTGQARIIGARFWLLKLCFAYAIPNSYCNRLDCRELHLCRDHVAGHCKKGVDCRKDHHFQGDHNKNILRALSLSEHQQESLMSLVRMTVPQVCRWHNRAVGGCPNKDACTRFHICDRFVKDICHIDQCQKSHDFEFAHSRRLLKAYGLDGKTKDDVKPHLLIHQIKHKGFNRNHFQIAADLRNLLEESDSEDDFKDAKEDVDDSRSCSILKKLDQPTFGIDDALCFGSSKVKTLPDPLDEFEMLQMALGEEDLLDYLDFQTAVAAQTEVKQLETVEANAVEETGSEVADIKDELHGDAQENEKEDEAIAPVQPNQGILTYSGYAPQGEKRYICRKYLDNKCSKEAEVCKKAHFVSPYLWQILVEGRWYNLDTVNEDIETTHSKGDDDYITNMPRDSPRRAGELITIIFRTMNAKLINALAKQTYEIRRLGVKNPVEKKLDPLKTVTQDKPKPYLDTPFLFKPKRNILLRKEGEKPETHVPIIAPRRKGRDITPIRKELVPNDDMNEVNTIAKETLFQWQIAIFDKWHNLDDANAEIEESYEDRAPGYITMVPASSTGADDRLIEIIFKGMNATFLDSNDTAKVRRISKEAKATDLDKGHQEIPAPVIHAHREDNHKGFQREEVADSGNDGVSETKELEMVEILSKQNKINTEVTVNITSAENNDTINDESSECLERKVETNDKSDHNTSKNAANRVPDLAISAKDGTNAITKAASDFTGSAERINATWQWSDDSEKWNNHTMQVCICLEEAYGRGKKMGKLQINDDVIKINFLEMTQRTPGKNIQVLRRVLKADVIQE